jgi:DNA polymerase/3'-5' exonuclease PolX
MSTGTRVSLVDARTIAEEIADALRPATHRIAVAGSIRRGLRDIGDIELVAIPRTHPEFIRDGFFGGQETEVDELQEAVDKLIADGVLAPHPTDPKRGPRYSKLLHVASGLQLDLFTARPHTWGLIFLIRTGPASYSQYLVTHARRRGFHVAGGELHVGSLGCTAIECRVVPTPEEYDVFKAIGVPGDSPDRRG